MPRKSVDELHPPPSERGAGPSAKEPLDGFMPRRVTGEQVLKAMVKSVFISILCITETLVKSMAM